MVIDTTSYGRRPNGIVSRVSDMARRHACELPDVAEQQSRIANPWLSPIKPSSSLAPPWTPSFGILAPTSSHTWLWLRQSIRQCNHTDVTVVACCCSRTRSLGKRVMKILRLTASPLRLNGPSETTGSSKTASRYLDTGYHRWCPICQDARCA